MGYIGTTAVQVWEEDEFRNRVLDISRDSGGTTGPLKVRLQVIERSFPESPNKTYATAWISVSIDDLIKAVKAVWPISDIGHMATPES